MTFSRDETAEWAGLTRPQINHLAKLGVVRPDVGGQRKKLSLLEARMAAVAAAFMRLRINPSELVELIESVRSQVSGVFPEDMSFDEMNIIARVEGIRRLGAGRAQDHLIQAVQKEWDATGLNADLKELLHLPAQLSDEQEERKEREISFREAAIGAGHCFIVVAVDDPKNVLVSSSYEDLAVEAEGWISLDVLKLFNRIGPSPRGGKSGMEEGR